MARPSIEFPPVFPFSTHIPVRITDLNYGGHVGNDAILSLIHEARMQFLQHYGYSEKDLGGTGTIMAEVQILFRNELFYGDKLQVHVAVTNLGRASFDILYQMQKEQEGKWIEVAHARTGMVCFDYERRRVTALPETVRSVWQEETGL